MAMRTGLPSLIGLAALFCLATPASAAITTSQITSPASPTYSTYDQDPPPPPSNTIAVSGTSNGTTGDLVDLNCYFRNPPIFNTIATNVPVDIGGNFSVAAASLNQIRDEVCRLRAVPATTTPTDLTPFAGPVMATGERETRKISSGVNMNAPYDYYIWGQQLTAAADYDSLGGCGIDDGVLYDSDFKLTTVTWFCNDWFWTGDNFTTPTRSGIKVDGANAYAPYGAQQIDPAASSGFPAFTYSYSLDPSNGNLTITESNPIVKCPDPTYPPVPGSGGSCPSFVDTGVRADRTITQESDGHLVFITDTWTSTDGQQHTLDMLPMNDNHFFGSGSGFNATTVAYQFPGESSFSTHITGDVVSFPDSSPAATYIEQQAAADGNHTTGQGAIVFDRPQSPATFFHVVTGESDFHFQQNATVPASGTSTFRFAYAHAYTSAEVQTLAQTALDRFATPPTPTPAPTPEPASTPSNSFTVARTKLNRKKGTATITVNVPGPGSLDLTGRDVVKQRPADAARSSAPGRAVSGAGAIKLTIKARGKARKKLNAKGRAKVKYTLTFTPTGGSPSGQTKSITLKKTLR